MLPFATPPVIVLDATDAGKRLDKALAERLPEFSRVRLQGLIGEGRVLVEDAVETNASRKLKGGERLIVDLPPPLPAAPKGEAIPLDIVYEDADLIVIDKPAGMVVHPSNGHQRGTLVHALIAHCGDSLSGINGVMRPGIVHRLDKDTTGLLVVAKNDRAHRKLADQFADHGRTGPLERRYLAVVWGGMPRKTGTIDAGIVRSSANRERMVVSASERARFAITHYEVIEEFRQGEQESEGQKSERQASKGLEAKEPVLASLIACRLETGRTHQIRVHLSHIGHPLLGDMLYGSGFRTKEKFLSEPARAALAHLGRQALHAEMLTFEHPKTGEILEFVSEPPDDFEGLRAVLAKV